MRVKVKINAVHQGAPAEVDIEVDMSPTEFVSYVRDIVPVAKKAMKMDKKKRKGV